MPSASNPGALAGIVGVTHIHWYIAYRYLVQLEQHFLLTYCTWLPRLTSIVSACNSSTYTRSTAQQTLTCLAGASTQVVEECTLDNWRSPLPGDVHEGRAEGAVVALGKFDALHKGHQCDPATFLDVHELMNELHLSTDCLRRNGLPAML